MISQLPRASTLDWEDKVKLQDIVDTLKFVSSENQQKFKCVGCGRLALCHYIAECDHLYCARCHGKTNEKKCLFEGCLQVVSKITQNIQLEEEIARLKVYCPFSKNGCLEEIALAIYSDQVAELMVETEEMKKLIEDLKHKNRLLEHQLSDFKSHQGLLIAEIQTEQKNMKQTITLQAEKIKFKNKSEMEKLKNFIRDLRSTNRLLEGEISSIRNQLPVQMEKIATETEAKISKLQEHINERMAKCDENRKTEYTDVRHALERHVQDKTVEMQARIKDLDLKLGSISGTGLSVQCTEYTWEVKEIGNLISEWLNGRPEVYSTTFDLRGTGIQNKVELILSGKDVCISCSFQQLSSFESQEPQFFKQSICILDQSETDTKLHNYRNNYPSFKDKADPERRYLFDRKTNFFIPIKLFEEKHHPYAVRDKVLIKFLIEPTSISFNGYFSYTGRLLWKIEKYKVKRKEGVEGINMVLYSDYFYSSETGYRMILETRFHHTSVLFGLRYVKGKYDDFLTPYFSHKSTLRILDQSKSGDNHLIRTCDSEEARFDKFIELRHEDIENDWYLKEECLLIEVTVESKALCK